MVHFFLGLGVFFGFAGFFLGGDGLGGFSLCSLSLCVRGGGIISDFEEGEVFFLVDLGVLRRIWRGWIVPVGGATPDRRQARAAQLVRERHREGGNAEGIGCPIVSGRGGLGGGGAFRSGVQPPTGARPERLSWFGSGTGRGGGNAEGIGCPIVSGRGGLGGGGSFRSGVQPPTGSSVPVGDSIPDRHRTGAESAPMGEGYGFLRRWESRAPKRSKCSYATSRTSPSDIRH